MTIKHDFIRAALMPLALALPALLSTPAHADERPSFLEKGDIFCPDELDFDNFRSTGKINTRGALQSCTVIDRMTQVIVLQGGGGKTMVRMVTGPFESQVGFSNGKLPVFGGGGGN